MLFNTLFYNNFKPRPEADMQLTGQTDNSNCADMQLTGQTLKQKTKTKT